MPIGKSGTWAVDLKNEVSASEILVLASFTADISKPSANHDQKGAGWYEFSDVSSATKVRLYYETR